MLQAIRDRITGVMAIIVLGLLAIPFAFFGIGTYFQPDISTSVAMVGDMEIEQREFQASFNSYRNQMRRLLGDSFDEMQYATPLARREHLESLIDQRLLRQFAVSGGMDIPQQQLAERIQMIEAFQVAGSFNADVYQQALAYQGLTPAQFEASLREDLVTQNLITALTNSGQALPGEIASLAALENQTRSVDYVFVNATPYRETFDVSDAQIETYYADHEQQFMRPDQVSIEYLDLNPHQALADIEPDEDELRDLYASQEARFVTEERRKAAHILLTAAAGDAEANAAVEQQIQDLSARIANGEAFADLAREYSQDPGSAEQGGELGWIEPGVMVDAFEDALYQLELGDVSAPVKTSFGWHLIKLEEIDPSVGKTFEQAREELAEEWLEDKLDREYRDRADEMVNLSFEHPDSLTPIADELGLQIQTSELFNRDSGQGIAANREVRDAAFSDLMLVELNNSDPIELTDQRMVIARIKDHIQATARPLTEVRDEISLLVQRELATQRAREVAENIASAAREQGDLTAALQSLTGTAAQADAATLATATASSFQQELSVLSNDNLSRTDYQLGQVFLEAVFTMNPATTEQPAILALPRNGQDWAVVQLRSVTNSTEPINDQLRDRLQRQLQANLATQELDALVAQLRTTTKIQIFEDRL